MTLKWKQFTAPGVFLIQPYNKHFGMGSRWSGGVLLYAGSIIHLATSAWLPSLYDHNWISRVHPFVLHISTCTVFSLYPSVHHSPSPPRSTRVPRDTPPCIWAGHRDGRSTPGGIGRCWAGRRRSRRSGSRGGVGRSGSRDLPSPHCIYCIWYIAWSFTQDRAIRPIKRFRLFQFSNHVLGSYSWWSSYKITQDRLTKKPPPKQTFYWKAYRTLGLGPHSFSFTQRAKYFHWKK